MPARGWYVLIHQLPPRPLYLRAKVRNRLARVGALALKNSVYVLPQRDDCLEDLQWIAQEAEAGGGEAYVCRTEFVAGISDKALVRQFQGQSAAAYEALKAEVGAVLAQARRGGPAPREALAPLLGRLEKRLEEVVATDFFDSPARKEAGAMVRVLKTRVHGREVRTSAPRPHPHLAGRTWVTRLGPKIDRLASAWLIRRFVDPGARFRFVEEGEGKRPDEVSFDMVGADFTHEGDRCTFETLVTRLGLDDPSLRPLAEIVHDVDLKDAKYGRPEAIGVGQLVQGLVRSQADDEARLARGLAFFDDLYASFEGAPSAATGHRGKSAKARRGPATSRARRA